MAAPVARSRLRGNAARRTVNVRLEKPAVSRAGVASGSNSVPVIAVTSGEPAGIGPDVCPAPARKKFAARIVVLAERAKVGSRALPVGRAARLVAPRAVLTPASIT